MMPAVNGAPAFQLIGGVTLPTGALLLPLAVPPRGAASRKGLLPLSPSKLLLCFWKKSSIVVRDAFDLLCCSPSGFQDAGISVTSPLLEVEANGLEVRCSTICSVGFEMAKALPAPP